jgi:serine/threonine-protein kinase RsbW
MSAAAITLAIDSQLDHVFLVGLSVRAVCAAVGFASDATDAVELSVVEAVNNCVEHAYGEAGHRVEVDLAFARETLRVGVRDRGRPLDWPAACARADAYEADPGAEGGRGLFIIRSLMDSVDYVAADGVNELIFTKHLPAAVCPPVRRVSS